MDYTKSKFYSPTVLFAVFTLERLIKYVLKIFLKIRIFVLFCLPMFVGRDLGD